MCLADRSRQGARALSELAAHLPEGQKQAVLAEALAAARGIGNEENRTHVLSGLAPHLANWGQRKPAEAVQAWNRTLRSLSRNRRPELLRDLQALYPFLFSLVPEAERMKVAEGVFRAIREVGEWWG